MKQVININFHGQVVPIEVSAFDILKKYTDTLARYFANEEGKDEIINDIESRIGELFQERLKKGATCITDDDVNAIIKSMGMPEEFDDAEETVASSLKASAAQENASQSTTADVTPKHKRLYRNENSKIIGGVASGIANYFGIDPIVVRILFVVLAFAGGTGLVAYFILWLAVPSTATNEIGGIRKKLYRDNDEKFIAGVCSGIGNYFGISAWVPRVFFLLPFLSFAFRLGHWGFMDFPQFLSLSFSPGALIVYIILWLVIPEANTTAEKLEMKGEKVDVNSIKNSVMGEMKDEKGKAIGTEMSGVAKKKGRSLGDVIVFLVKAFAYFIIGCVAIVLVVVLFFLAITAFGIFPLKDYVLRDGWQNFCAWGVLIFFISVPVIGIITWIIRRLAKVKGNSKIIRWAFISLWIIGWASLFCFGASIVKDFKTTNNITEGQEVVLTNPGIKSIEFTSPEDIVLRNHKNRFLRFTAFSNITDEDTLYVNNVHFRIMKSTNDSFHIFINKQADGRSIKEAESTASTFDYSITQADSIVRLPLGIAITRKNIFRNQRVTITVFVPVGKKIKINQDIWDRTGEGRLNFNGDHFSDWEDYWGSEERGWTTNVEYIMKADGLYTLDGIPAKERRTSEDKIRIHDHHIEINEDGKHVIIDGNSVKIDGETIEDAKARKLDSLERRQQLEKDSVNIELDKKQAKEKEKVVKQGSQPSAYSTPIGLPILNSLM